MKHLLRGLSYILAPICGFSFLFGGGLIRAIGNVDRLFAEILGIGVAFVCLIGIVIARHVIEDIEWQEANEEAADSENRAKS
jgi:hypothetical protein